MCNPLVLSVFRVLGFLGKIFLGLLTAQAIFEVSKFSARYFVTPTQQENAQHSVCLSFYPWLFFVELGQRRASPC
jgi:hypothetical protein